MIRSVQKCSKCKVEKPLDAFKRNKSRKNGRAWVCWECQRKYQADWYSRNKEAHYKRVKENQRKNKEFIRSLKDVPCVDCGVRYPHYVMDFDHVRGTKLFGLGDNKAFGASREVLLAEVAKCDVVCANCHRIRTHSRMINE